jgi:hypothetical protein
VQELEHGRHIVFWWRPAGHENEGRKRCSDHLAGIYAIEAQRYLHPVSNLRAVCFGMIIQILVAVVQTVQTVQMVAVVAVA